MRKVVRSGIALAITGTLMLSPAMVNGASAKARSSNKESKLVTLINRARANNGRGTLKVSSKLLKKARRHSRQMAKRGGIYHSSCMQCLADRPGWNAIGENVARGGGIRMIHRRLMASSGHRTNILHGAFKRVGVGIVEKAGRYYVTQVFVG